MIKDINSRKIVSVVTFWLILAIAVIFRVTCIDKVNGLWYDELTMYNEAVKPTFLQVLFFSLRDDVHFPLYQILLHYWGQIFSFSDVALRSFSVVLGILTVITGYFIGKSLNSRALSYVIMALFAVNSSLIYYSQEVKMYELMTLLASLNLLFLIRIDRFNSITDRLFWILSTIFLIFSYVISFVYVVIEIICFVVYRYKKISDKFYSTISALGAITIPLLILFYLLKHNMKNFVNGMYCDWSSLFVVLQNFFTPKLVGIGNNPVHYMAQFVQNFSFSNIIFVILPIAIVCYFIFKVVKEDKFARLIFAISLLFVLFEIIAFIFTDFKILSRYLLIILPNLLVIVAIGVDNLKNKISVILLSIFLLVNFAYLVYSPRASYKLGREGYLPIVKLMQENNIQDNDIVFVWNRKEVLSKYLDKKVIVLSVLIDIAYKSEYVFANQDRLNNSTTAEKKEILKDYFISRYPAENTEILMAFVISKMKPKQKVMLVTNGYFDDFIPDEFYKQVKDKKSFDMFTFNNLMTTKATLDLKYICDHNLKKVGTYKNGFYVLQVWEK